MITYFVKLIDVPHPSVKHSSNSHSGDSGSSCAELWCNTTRPQSTEGNLFSCVSHICC